MARDYAKREVYPRKKAQKSPNALWILISLIVGAATLLGLYFYRQGSMHFQLPVVVEQEKNTPPKRQKPKHVVEKPKFDFYTLLPQDEVTLSNQKPEAAKNQAAPATIASAKKDASQIIEKGTKNNGSEVPVIDRSIRVKPEQIIPASNEESGRYFIQAGSFKSPHEAEQLKVKLALLGHRADIKSSQMQGEKRYKVVLGPYGNKTTADVKQHQLTQNQINSFIFSTPP